MMAPSSAAFEMVKQALVKYVDVEPSTLEPSTVLTDIGVDSLTLAELLFELEDKLHVTIAETKVLPTNMADLVALVEPHLPTDTA